MLGPCSGYPGPVVGVVLTLHGGRAPAVVQQGQFPQHISWPQCAEWAVTLAHTELPFCGETWQSMHTCMHTCMHAHTGCPAAGSLTHAPTSCISCSRCTLQVSSHPWAGTHMSTPARVAWRCTPTCHDVHDGALSTLSQNYVSGAMLDGGEALDQNLRIALTQAPQEWAVLHRCRDEAEVPGDTGS